MTPCKAVTKVYASFRPTKQKDRPPQPICMQPLTIRNNAAMFFSASPTHLEASMSVVTLINVDLHSVAAALASRVLPVPGGPTRIIP